MEPNNTKSIEEENNNSHPKQSTWDGDKMMSMAAIFISVLSMFAVAYQSYLVREENEMMRIQQSASVLPYLKHAYSEANSRFTFNIMNKGLGPAFIKEVQFKAIDPESKDSLFFNNSDFLASFMVQKSAFLKDIPNTTYTFIANNLVSQNEKISLFSYKYDNQNQKLMIREEFDKYYVGFNIVYEDVYGTAWRLSSNSNAPIKLKKN